MEEKNMEEIRNPLYDSFCKFRAKYEGSGYMVISQTDPKGMRYCFAALDPEGLYDSPLSVLAEFECPVSERYAPCYRVRDTRSGSVWSEWWRCEK